VEELAQQIRRDPGTGFEIVGACLPGMGGEATVDEGCVPVLGPLSAVVDAIDASGADTVMVTSGPGVTGAALRRLGWALEGKGVDLVVAPALTEVSGPRISMRPVAGLPMLHLDEPEIDGHRHLLKQVIERASAAVLLVLLLPALAIIALAVRLTSRGPALFRQTRVGVRGKEFTLFKFRSMDEDAEEWLPSLAEHNEFDGPMFKIRRDPRVTPIGRFIRRWSLDELPQLWNVVRGDMALIGPRPPLPHEVSQYAEDVRRRLLVRPGLTGLWQVSGRSNLSWEETVRLDLSYVENWSLALDLQILWRTVWAVLRGRGAY
jgi:exopolysaccharide biosynthesis polyprenyl glycosylphosphotransferase